MSESPRYRAYLLRLWLVDDNGQPVWRAALEDPRSGERLGFADAGQLVAFLQEQLALQRSGLPPGAGSQAPPRRQRPERR